MIALHLGGHGMAVSGEDLVIDVYIASVFWKWRVNGSSVRVLVLKTCP